MIFLDSEEILCVSFHCCDVFLFYTDREYANQNWLTWLPWTIGSYFTGSGCLLKNKDSNVCLYRSRPVKESHSEGVSICNVLWHP